jgi:hypothetical protein
MVGLTGCFGKIVGFNGVVEGWSGRGGKWTGLDITGLGSSVYQHGSWEAMYGALLPGLDGVEGGLGVRHYPKGPGIDGINRSRDRGYQGLLGTAQTNE